MIKGRSTRDTVGCVTDAEDEITADLVAELLREQHPDLAGLPLTFGARGWDNQLWRLGDELAVRLPWATQGAYELLLKEHSLLPAMAPRLPLQVPVPQRLGQPSEQFPRSWIVTTWVPGEPADRVPATRGAVAADTLAAFLAALHQPAPDDAPAGRLKRVGQRRHAMEIEFAGERNEGTAVVLGTNCEREINQVGQSGGTPPGNSDEIMIKYARSVKAS